jgi:hypothetical protein
MAQLGMAESAESRKTSMIALLNIAELIAEMLLIILAQLDTITNSTLQMYPD